MELFIQEHRQLERHTIIAIGVVWAWLLPPPQKAPIGWYIPIVLVVITGLRSTAILLRLRVSTSYIRTIERYFGVEGWETTLLEKHSWFIWSSVAIWTLMITLVIAPFLFKNLQNASSIGLPH